MSLNFGSLANTQTANSTAYLKPYNIYKDVEIDNLEVREGTTENGKWKCLNVTFKAPEGIHTHSIFYPKDGDDQRKEVDTKNGGKRLTCSNFEITMAMVAAIGHAYNPEGFKKLQEMSKNFKTFDDVVKGLTAILNKTKGVKTSMKLIGRTTKDGKVYARLPQPLGIMQDKATEEWRTFPIAIFGDNLTFSAYEQQESDKYHAAKPTKIADPTPAIEEDSITKPNMDLDALLGEL